MVLFGDILNLPIPIFPQSFASLFPASWSQKDDPAGDRYRDGDRGPCDLSSPVAGANPAASTSSIISGAI